MRHRIEGYRSFPGEHCGSVAMRGLLAHYCGPELPEDVVFGLGAGLDCMYMPVPALAKLLWRASEGEDTWGEAGGLAHEIAGIEQALFEALARRCDLLA